jgi:hypothetical protein
MGLPARIFRPSGPTHGRAPIPFFKSNRYNTHGTKPHHQPPSAWQVSLGLENSNLPPPCEVGECSILSRIIGRVPDNSG